MNNHTKRRGIALTVFLVGVNILAWIWAFCVFHHHAVMLSAAILAYSFGLRHA
ncbi:HoxN/HupN/NixA family nickel/cobalt transporter, partial [Salmonella enterica subsp. enterica serovar Dublin]|nr:HoxN/HupN/NixA family nickel/cobalt transporter [Salmonella enterica subsp. enterica serovar Dublin]ECB1532703.1 HoxN/HupN/NixA family nickel/cobalt transporter [Salmonella enterica subsp. enterica serovar Dublin]ECB5107927.1 HoxN/HupN/NixA family nickel/cobalt transporter [Salmonella enterica subsp. enterica serovar Dublin]